MAQVLLTTMKVLQRPLHLAMCLKRNEDGRRLLVSNADGER
jgi:hypothetical protein